MTGAPDYGTGDLVVCVDAIQRPYQHVGVQPRMTLGKVFLVADVRLMGRVWRVFMDGIVHINGWDADRFRKVDPLPDALVALLKAEPAPVPERVTA